MDQQTPLTKQEKRALRMAERNSEAGIAARARFMKKFSLWGTVIVGLALVGWGMVYMVTRPVADPIVDGTPITITGVAASDHSKGSDKPKLTLIEYSDFQCPACAVYYPVVKQLAEEFKSDVLFVYRNFPLPQHANAFPAARAAEAAGKQGKFWEMHDKLFETQIAWENSVRPYGTFSRYATELGLNLDQFEADYDSSAVKNKIDADIKSGQSAGVNGTPSFYLNGVKINNPRSYDDFKLTLINALNK